MSQLSVNAITNAAGGNTATINGFTPTISNMSGRNRIINGEMRIDQRNNGASVALTDGLYYVDRWKSSISQTSRLTGQRSSIAPAGFVNSLSATVGTAFAPGAGDYAGLVQPIEGNNVADLGFGSAGASTVTVSFWVRSSVTGTYSVALHNSDANRSYVTTYTVNSANTWEQKSVTIAGDTTGTWLTTNGVGITAYFALGMGSTFGGATANTWNASLKLAATGQTQWVQTAGATFYITGVQLEAGSVATPFERRPYGTELALCQRYFQFWKSGWGGVSGGSGYQYSDGVNFFVPTRATPTLALTSWSTGARFPQASWFTSNVGVEGFLSVATANAAGGNDNWLATGTASAEL